MKQEKLEDESIINKIAPGVVLIKKGLNQQQQIFWTEYALKVGEDKNQGFWTYHNGVKEPNLGRRGRVYDAITAYQDSSSIIDLCNHYVKIAQSVDDQMPSMN